MKYIITLCLVVAGWFTIKSVQASKARRNQMIMEDDNDMHEYQGSHTPIDN